MAGLLDINLAPDDSTLRKFGFISLAGFGGLSALAWHEALMFSFGLGSARFAVTSVLGVLAVLTTLFSLVWPRGNLPIYLGLSLLSYPIGLVVSHVMLFALFFGLFAPMALVLRLIGRDPMQRKKQPQTDSYWTQARAGRTRDSYFRQF